MLEKIDLGKRMGKKEYKEAMEEMQPKLALLQRKCKELGIPVIVLFEGFGASGKGLMIARLIEPLDPRGFKVYTIDRANEEEKAKPFLWRFFTKTPAKGQIALFDRSWFTKVLRERLEGLTTNHELDFAYDEINKFEKLLTDDGTVLIKFFLHITKEEQEERFHKLVSDPATAWRVTSADWEHNKAYDSYMHMHDEMLEKTDMEYAPWTIIEAMDKEYATCKVYQTVINRLTEACKQKEDCLNKQKKEKKAEKKSDNKKVEETVITPDRFMNGVLKACDLSVSISKEKYKKELKHLQDRLLSLQNELYLKKIPAVFAFEGWDAAGKGGAIKRLTENLDPRGYEVIPISAPDETERSHHYLWRFYKHFPKAGHIAIFDRTWYGRVMVERIEGFTKEEDWKRAYSEINHMEEQLTDAGAVVIKFWLHIDKDEQERRFHDRETTPGKEWKITEEDWRNRSKWDEYEKAVDEMIVKTSTTYAPWIVVEANDKPYARIKVLRSIVEALEDRIERKKS